MPSKYSCARCGRRIEEGLEHRINGRVYGVECAFKVASNLSTPSLQEELFTACNICGAYDESDHKFWCSKGNGRGSRS